MLIIYDDNGDIKFSTSDDYYVSAYKERKKSMPFMNFGTKSLWLRNEPFISDTELYRIVNEKLVKKEDSEINVILEYRKNKQRINHTMYTVENVKVHEVTDI